MMTVMHRKFYTFNYDDNDNVGRIKKKKKKEKNEEKMKCGNPPNKQLLLPSVQEGSKLSIES